MCGTLEPTKAAVRQEAPVWPGPSAGTLGPSGSAQCTQLRGGGSSLEKDGESLPSGDQVSASSSPAPSAPAGAAASASRAARREQHRPRSPLKAGPGGLCPLRSGSPGSSPSTTSTQHCVFTVRTPEPPPPPTPVHAVNVTNHELSGKAVAACRAWLPAPACRAARSPHGPLLDWESLSLLHRRPPGRPRGSRRPRAPELVNG